MSCTREDREKDARIAEMIGWTELHPGLFSDGPLRGIPLGESHLEDVPAFHDDQLSSGGYSARHYLLTWLAGDLERWTAFVTSLKPVVCPNAEGVTLREMMLAKPSQVATAAIEAVEMVAEARSW